MTSTAPAPRRPRDIFDRIIVLLETPLRAPVQRVVADCGGKYESAFTPSLFVVRVDEAEAPAIVRNYVEHPAVKRADFDITVQHGYTPSDPLVTDARYWWPDAINLFPAWDITGAAGCRFGSPSIVIGGCDGGIMYGPAHPDIKWPELEFNSYYLSSAPLSAANPIFRFGEYQGDTMELHQQFIYGILAATPDNGIGFAGVAPSCKQAVACMASDLVDVNHLHGTLVDYANGCNWISNLINQSGVARVVQTSSIYNLLPLDDPGPAWAAVYQSVIDTAYGNGVPFFVCAGNENEDCLSPSSGAYGWTPGTKVYPAALYPKCFPVGAVDSSLQQAIYQPNRVPSGTNGSNYGAAVMGVAPGKGVLTTIIDSVGQPGYGTEDGTSFATPMIAAVAGLMLSVNPSLTVDQVYGILQNTGTNLHIVRFPNGPLANAAAAVAAARGKLAVTGQSVIAPGTVRVTMSRVVGASVTVARR